MWLIHLTLRKKKISHGIGRVKAQTVRQLLVKGAIISDGCRTSFIGIKVILECRVQRTGVIDQSFMGKNGLRSR